MNHEQLQKWLDEQIQKAREFCKEKGKPPMTSLEESALRERLRYAMAR